MKDRQNLWRPPKRVAPTTDGISSQRQRIYRLRTELAAESHPAFAEAIEAGSFELFKKRLRRLRQKKNLQMKPHLQRRQKNPKRLRMTSRKRRSSIWKLPRPLFRSEK